MWLHRFRNITTFVRGGHSYLTARSRPRGQQPIVAAPPQIRINLRLSRTRPVRFRFPLEAAVRHTIRLVCLIVLMALLWKGLYVRSPSSSLGTLVIFFLVAVFCAVSVFVVEVVSLATWLSGKWERWRSPELVFDEDELLSIGRTLERERSRLYTSRSEHSRLA